MGGGGGSNKIEETEQQKALAEVSMNQWRNYLDMYRPVENNYMKNVERMNTDTQYQQATNMAALPVEHEFSEATNRSARELTSRGINPNSGLFKAELDKLDRNKASLKADMTNQAQFSQQNRYVQGLQNVTAMGQGQATDSIQGMGDISSMSAARARNDANIGLQNREANRQLVGAGVGAATRYGLQKVNTSSDDQGA